MTELHEKFRKRWPDMMTDIPCGFYLPPGWEGLVWDLCEEIAPLVGGDFRVEQVKEKFGGLRFYVSEAPQSVHRAIELAEAVSVTICQQCGEPGETRGKGWVVTICDKCNEGK